MDNEELLYLTKFGKLSSGHRTGKGQFLLQSQKRQCQRMLKGEGEVAQSCPTLCDPVDCNLLGLSVHGIFQARILEWIAISFSRGSSWPRDQTQVSHIGGRRFNLWATREARYASNHSPNADAHGLHFEDKGLDQLPGLLRTTLLAYQPLPRTLLLYVLAWWQIYISLPRHLSWTKVIRILSFQLH